MRAILVADNRELVWAEVPDAQPREGEVLIEVHAAALNRADLLQRAGHYPPPPGWPEWMGLEVAGVVTRAPAGGRWQPGDRVCALLGGGGYAEQVAVPAEMVLPVPPGLSMEEAAGIPEVFATAYLNLCLEGALQRGETVFIQAGASGVGLAAIQIAKASGARVVTTVGSPEKAEFVARLGADLVINHRREDVLAVLRDNPVDVGLDCVAGPHLGGYLGTVSHGARWVVIATLGGPQTQLDMNQFFRRGIRLIGSTLRSRTTRVKAEVLAELESRFWPEFSSGKMKSVLHEVLPIQQAAAAHEILQQNQNIGKVVLTVNAGEAAP